jgi:hypothetical protein
MFLLPIAIFLAVAVALLAVSILDSAHLDFAPN